MTRPISTIAAEIEADWSRVNYAAEPYLAAMFSLTTVDSAYGYDSAASVIRYFLANAGSWRGETARRVKAELKGMVAGRY